MRRVRAWSLVVGCVAVLASGCVTRERTVSTFAFADHRAALASGHDVVVSPVGDPEVRLRATDPIDVITFDGVHHALHVADVVDGCPAGERDDSSELCRLHDVDRVVIGHRRVLSPTFTRVAMNLASIAALGGMIYCTAECASPYNYLTGGLLVAGVAGAAALLYALSGGHAE